MKINDKISVRRALREDAGELAGILKMSFGVDDNQRALGKRVTAALFKIIPALEGSMLLAAEDGNKIVGYLWMQLDELSFAGCWRGAPLDTLGAIAAVLREFKFKQAFRAMKSQSSTGSFCVPCPKIMSLAVNGEARRRGIGSALIAGLERYLAGKGINDYFVLTSADNPGAVCFYEKNGFNKYKDNKEEIIFCKTIAN